MANFDEKDAKAYDWTKSGIYVIENTDMVEGGLDGISNRQGRELATRTRNLHERLTDLKTEAAERDDRLDEAINTKTEEALNSSKEYTDTRETAILAAADTKATAALRSSKEYTDTTAVAVRSEMVTADTKALRDAKSYADTIVAALVSSSPEALNTLQELAAALGNDPNFATTVMNEIGRRATTEQVEAAVEAKVAGKANINGNPSEHFDALEFYIYRSPTEFRGICGGTLSEALNNNDVFMVNSSDIGSVGLLSRKDPYFIRHGTWEKHALYHTGNFNPALKAYLHGSLDNEFSAFALYVAKSNTEFKGIINGTYSASLTDNDVLLANWSPTGAVGLLSKEDPYVVRYGDLAKKQTIYHTGNVNMATTTAHGFMSAADKAKLDAVSPVKIYARGKVLGDLGSGISGSGQNGLVKVTVSREPNYKKGVYRLTHNLGLAGVCTFISLTRSKEQYSLTYRIDEDTPDYAIVRVHDIVNYNAYADCDFNYVIMV